MKIYKRESVIFITIFSLMLLPVSGMALNEEEGAEEATTQVEDSQTTPTTGADEDAASDEPGLAESAVTDKNDKSGTNPINFQRDLRIYNEYLWLNTAGDGNQNLTTLEFRTPFAGGKWQFRTRIPYNAVTADVNGDGMDNIDDSGLGDINFRLMTVPWLKGVNAFAVGMDVFLNTASEDSLGAGNTSLAPVIFFGHFFQGGFGPWKKGGLFAPGLQYKFSVDEDTGRDKTKQIIIDINYLLMAEDGQSWLFAEPQIVFDQQTDAEFAIMDIEFGWMMTKWWPDLKGQSFYLRPTFTIGSGSDRPTDYGIEVAYKFVGW
jgi:hypothetical protein